MKLAQHSDNYIDYHIDTSYQLPGLTDLNPLVSKKDEDDGENEKLSVALCLPHKKT